MDLPFFCIIGNRPVKAVETDDGGMEVLAFNWDSGEFERDMKYLDRILSGDAELTIVESSEFEERLNQLLIQNKVDYLSKAIQIACKAHENQKDKAGSPYILHPLRLMQKFQEEDTMIVAVLHDVVEDSDIDLAFLKDEGFNKNIVMAVDALTKRENESYMDFIARLALNDLAVKVKIEDIIDNLNLTRLKKVDEKDFERIKKYHQALTFLQ